MWRGAPGGPERYVLGHKSFVPPARAVLRPSRSNVTKWQFSILAVLRGPGVGNGAPSRSGLTAPCSLSYPQHPEPAQPEAAFPGPVSFLLTEGRREQSQEQGEHDGDSPGWRRPPLPLPRMGGCGWTGCRHPGRTELGPRGWEAGSELNWKWHTRGGGCQQRSSNPGERRPQTSLQAAWVWAGAGRAAPDAAGGAALGEASLSWRGGFRGTMAPDGP